MKRAFAEGLVVLALGAVLALVTNAVRPGGLSLRADPRSLRMDAGVKTLDLAGAHAAFEKGAVFVDARPRTAYLAGHVEGAISIPPENAEAAYRASYEFLPRGTDPVVIYASAKEASLAGMRASWLATLGHQGAVVLVDGWESWQRAGYPTKAGEEAAAQ